MKMYVTTKRRAGKEETRMRGENVKTERVRNEGKNRLSKRSNRDSNMRQCRTTNVRFKRNKNENIQKS
jgi:hypothetical protein